MKKSKGILKAESATEHNIIAFCHPGKMVATNYDYSSKSG